MYYPHGVEIKKGDLVAQLWEKETSLRYLGTVTSIVEGQLIRIEGNASPYLSVQIPSSDLYDSIRFLRRKDDVRLGDDICIKIDQFAAPKDSTVTVVNLAEGRVEYHYGNSRVLWSADFRCFTIVRTTGYNVVSSSTDRCTCGGPSIKTGFNTLILTVCTICHKEK